ncbi:unnamed protein product [Prorocentrum cordatum]|uniref:Uncharacterized protein n=1 Tax=Prorocentrum cordatum TaxID=2364126 RepID=A0ABN9TAY2_9DINO|nr:unnamed protein product [Polarella glacialis]
MRPARCAAPEVAARADAADRVGPPRWPCRRRRSARSPPSQRGARRGRLATLLGAVAAAGALAAPGAAVPGIAARCLAAPWRGTLPVWRPIGGRLRDRWNECRGAGDVPRVRRRLFNLFGGAGRFNVGDQVEIYGPPGRTKAIDHELAASAGPADARIGRLEAELSATFTALPKDAEGGLGHQAVRYALHRLFVQRHGWYIKGLEPGTSAESSSDWVPSYLEGRLRRHLAGKGAALRDLALFAAAIEDLVTVEAVQRMRAAYEMLELPTLGNLTQEDAQQLVVTFFVGFLRAGNFSASTPQEAKAKVGIFQTKYTGWSQAHEWLLSVVGGVTGSRELEGGLDLAGAERLAAEVGERYHAFNDGECRALKREMEELQVYKAGRVRLPHFYRKALYSHWEFNEKTRWRTCGLSARLMRPRRATPW